MSIVHDSFDHHKAPVRMRHSINTSAKSFVISGKPLQAFTSRGTPAGPPYEAKARARAADLTPNP
jgi:hypothetical protein